MWLRSRRIEHAWVALDTRDNDTRRFWERFAAAAAVVWEPAGDVTLDQLDQLVEEIATGTVRTIVLDDVHVLVEPDAVGHLAHVLRRWPATVHLVVISRSRPALGLARLHAGAVAAAVDAEELAFTAEEIADLLRPTGSASADTARRIARLTGGWPVAVALSRGIGAAGFAAADAPQAQIAHYLAEEVLNGLSEPVRDLIRGAVVLDEVTVPAVNATLGIDDAEAGLGQLAAQGLLLTEVRGGWRMHAVIRDLLQDDLERRSPSRARELHLRASDYFADADPARAVTHALAADAFEVAADHIERSLAKLQEMSYSSQLRWFQALPESIIQARPALSSHGALVAAFERRLDLAARWLPDDAGTDTTAGLGNLTMRYVVLGDMPRLRAAAAQLHARADENSTLWQLGHGALTGALYATGDSVGALEVITGMFRPVDSLPSQFLALYSTARAVACCLLLDLGRVEQARAALDELRDWVDDAGSVDGYDDLGVVDWAAAMLALADGDVAAAARWAVPPAAEAALGLPFLGVWLDIDFARARMAAGDERAARRALYRAQTRLGRFADPALLEDRLREAGEPLGFAVPDRAADPPADPLAGLLSERERAVLRLLDSELSLREIAEHLYLSPNTLKTHVRAVYRKLGVGSRLSAVRAARGVAE